MAARSDKDKKSEPSKKLPETGSKKTSSKKKFDEEDDLEDDDDIIKPKKSPIA